MRFLLLFCMLMVPVVSALDIMENKFSNIYDDLYDVWSLDEKRQAWADFKFSNPGEHDPSNFTYAVHMLEFGEPKYVFGKDEYIDLLKEPFRVKELYILSASVISEQNVTVWGDTGFGLILKIPSTCLYAGHYSDLKSYSVRSQFKKSIERGYQSLRNRFDNFGLPSPSELVNKTQAGDYNELLVTGTSYSGEDEVRVTGYIIVLGSDGIPVIGEENARVLAAFAKKNDLPVVAIVQQ
jgi:hypothetical protein